jgi:hypothetical protein
MSRSARTLVSGFGQAYAYARLVGEISSEQLYRG